MSNIFENKGAMAATIVVAASNSRNQAAANYVCDGVADDVEINAAIAALPAGGGKVVLLDGTYNIAATINLRSNLWFEGAGGEATMLNQQGGLAADIFYGIDIAYTTLQGFRIWAMGQTAGDGIHFEGGAHINMVDIASTNCFRHGICIEMGAGVANPWGFYLRDIELYSNGGDGLYTNPLTYSVVAYIESSLNTSDGIHHLGQSVIYLVPWLEANTGFGARISGADIIGGIVSSNISGGIYFSYSNACSLKTIYVTNNGGTAGVGAGAVAINECYGCLIEGLFLLNNNGAGCVSHISLINSARNKIAQCHFEGTPTRDINIEATVLDTFIEQGSYSTNHWIRNLGTRTRTFNCSEYVPPTQVKDTVSNILEILGSVRGLWCCQENSGTSVADYSRNARTLTISKTLTGFDTWVRYQGNGGIITFNGSDERLSRADAGHAFSFANAAGNDDSPFTLVCVLSPVADTLPYTVASKYNENTPAREWILRIDANGYLEMELYDESVDEYIGREYQTSVIGQSLIIVFVTYDGSETSAGIKIYVGGVQVDNANHQSAGAYIAMEQLGPALEIISNVVGGGANGNWYKGEGTWFGITEKELSANEVWSATKRLEGVLGK